jgi:hypothetical protein
MILHGGRYYAGTAEYAVLCIFRDSGVVPRKGTFVCAVPHNGQFRRYMRRLIVNKKNDLSGNKLTHIPPEVFNMRYQGDPGLRIEIDVRDSELSIDEMRTLAARYSCCRRCRPSRLSLTRRKRRGCKSWGCRPAPRTTKSGSDTTRWRSSVTPTSMPEPTWQQRMRQKSSSKSSVTRTRRSSACGRI